MFGHILKVSEKEKKAISEMSKFYVNYLKKAISNYSLAEEYLFSADLDFKNLELLGPH